MYCFYCTSAPPNHWLSIYTRHFIGLVKDRIPTVKIHFNTHNTGTSIYRKPVSLSIPKEEARSSHLHRKEQPTLTFQGTLQLSQVLGSGSRQAQPEGKLWILYTTFGTPPRGSLFSFLAIFSINAQCSPEPREPSSPSSLETYTFCVPPFAVGPSLENQLGKWILNKVGMPNENGSWSPTEESVF